MTTLAAIETNYAGCRFRSRLEARWAVFFDKLSIRWLYEPQGYVLGNGDRYLPDFWLPDQSLWVEVKGAPTEADWIKLHAATAVDGLPLQYENGATLAAMLSEEDITRIPTLNRILLLGEIPHPDQYGWRHVVTVLTAHGPAFHEAFIWGRLDDGGVKARLVQIGPDYSWRVLTDAGLEGRDHWALRSYKPALGAYEAARSARFEHGESGAP